MAKKIPLAAIGGIARWVLRGPVMFEENAELTGEHVPHEMPPDKPNKLAALTLAWRSNRNSLGIHG